MPGEILQKDFISKYDTMGDHKFYKFLLCYAIEKLLKIRDGEFKSSITPEIEFLEQSEKFLIFYRRDDKEIYLNISKVFRKAAHKIYRVMLKKNLTQKNMKFLNLV